MQLDVIVVTYNNARDVRACIASILANGAHPLVVDNGSTDATLQILSSEFCDVPVYNNPRNGYSRAANIGFAHTTSDVVVLSNADVIYPEGTIALLSDHMMEHGDIGVLGPQQIYPDGSWQRSWGLATGFREAVAELFGITTAYNALRRILWSVRVNRRPVDVGYVDGAIMVVRRSTFNAIGGFDERFPFSSEETDFCLRARLAGWRITSLPTVDVIHRRGGSAVPAHQQERAMLEGTRLLLQKNRGNLYIRCYFAIKHLFNAYMFAACSVLVRFAKGSFREHLRSKAMVHRSYLAELGRLRRMGLSQDSRTIMTARMPGKSRGIVN